MNFKNLMLIITLSIILAVDAQISESQSQQIDSIFLEWNLPNRPGGAIGVLQNSKTVFSKAYGLASLEYLVPNTKETIFNTGSVSKQFTAMGIVLLQQQGKLSFDDDIRKHLPEIPEFKYPITIRHLLHHTSGLRSLHAMLELAGWRGDDARTNADLNRFMTNQVDLNFKPGEEYAYCNTGYMLMVNIIEKITKEKFPDWMKASIFEPLGMTSTYVEDNYARIVPNNATSYHKGQTDELDRAIAYWGYVGSGNMHATTSDLLKWLKNFYDPQENWEASFELMQTLDKFNDGSDNNYAFGVVLDTNNGHDRIQHGGAIGGFRAFVAVYPEAQLSIAVLTNFSSSSPGSKADRIAEILLPKLVGDPMENENTITSLNAMKLSGDQLKKYEGSYWNDVDNYARKIYVKNDTLRYSRSERNESPIVPIGKDEFQMLGVDADLKVKFEINGNKKSMMIIVDQGQPDIFESFEPMLPSKEAMVSYTGKFYSPELETSYSIYAKHDTLYYHHPRHGDFKMKVVKNDILEGEWPLLVAKYQRAEDGKISGISVSNGRVRNLWFEKLE
ncbi:MAG: serine hydrolase domain-containing protein [Saonia sp.]